MRLGATEHLYLRQEIMKRVGLTWGASIGTVDDAFHELLCILTDDQLDDFKHWVRVNYPERIEDE